MVAESIVVRPLAARFAPLLQTEHSLISCQQEARGQQPKPKCLQLICNQHEYSGLAIQTRTDLPGLALKPKMQLFRLLIAAVPRLVRTVLIPEPIMAPLATLAAVRVLPVVTKTLLDDGKR